MKPSKTLQMQEFEKVEEFLNGKTINSERTKRIYRFALSHFQTFLSKSEYNYNVESILTPINEKTIDVYVLFRKFVEYLSTREYLKVKLSRGSISLYVAGVRSYLEYHDIDISPGKWKKRVPMPKKYYYSKQAIDAEDIRTLLLACTNVRLKVFILVLASSGMRANEATSLRLKDIYFSQSPTKVHLRPEITKTRQENDIYISDEASRELKKFIESKSDNDLIFSIGNNEPQTRNIYVKLNLHFKRLLDKVEMNERREGLRMQVSFHSFRRFVKTTISNQGYGDYSEWILGHRSSMSMKYYDGMKEQERREIYKKCMKYLTFLDYPTVNAVGKDFESKLQERDKEIDQLKTGMEELKRMYMKSVAGHVVMESDLDSKGRTKRKIMKN